MIQWEFPGARWWKFDFHTHTPASDDFMQGCPQRIKDEVTPEFWLRKFMERKIDCVAITDHNSGEWIVKLQQKYEELGRSSGGTRLVQTPLPVSRRGNFSKRGRAYSGNPWARKANKQH